MTGEELYTGSDDEENSHELKGFLSKWTNYIHGWQVRFIVLKDSTLSYYKSAEDSDFGCRGAISLERAIIKESEIDPLRFDVSVAANNLVWYLRAENVEDKNNWVEVLKSFRIEDEPTTTPLKRHGSSLSIQSNTLSTASGSSIKHNSRSLREKAHEIETFRDILSEQISVLQRYFEVCSINGGVQQLETDADVRIVDFKGEAITFRETTSGVITTINHCLDIIMQKEDSMKKMLDREVEKRKKLEEELKNCREELLRSKTNAIGPDMEEEGPNSTIPEDEFYDAVETGLEKIEEVRQIRVKLKLQNQQSQIDAGKMAYEGVSEIDDFGNGTLARYHTIWPEIEKVCGDQIHHALKGVSDNAGDNGWQLFAEEGEMKMYRREEEVNGMVVDPLKSCHVVKGCTAREMCHYFFDPAYRNDWETTLEHCQIIEEVAKDTLVFLQTHKRIWPASQRDALFWSHMRKIDDGLEIDAKDAWCVCNHSTDSANYPPANQGNCIRIYLTVILLCQTFVRAPKNGEKLSRDDLTCKITYCAQVNPGGWVKPTILRSIYKKEYPKFLKRFTSYVLDTVKSQPIKF